MRTFTDATRDFKAVKSPRCDRIVLNVMKP